MNAIKAFDFSGYSVCFSTEGRNVMKSLVGSVVMLLFYLVGLTFFIYSLVKFLNKEDYSIEVFSLTQEYDQELKLKDSNFTLTYAIIDSNFNFSYEAAEFFEFETIQHVYEMNGVNSYSALPTKKCSRADFEFLDEDSKESINKRYSLSNFNCLDKETVNIGGQVFTSNTKTHIIRLKLKESKNNSIDLANLKTLIKKDKLQFFSAYTTSFINLENKENMVKQRLGIKTRYLSFEETLRGAASFSNSEFVDTSDILLGNTKTTSSIDFVDFEFAYQLRENANETLFAEIKVHSFQNSVRIVRKFRLFAQFLSETTVLLFNIYSFLSFCVRKANKLILVRNVSKEVFFTNSKVKAMIEPKEDNNADLEGKYNKVELSVFKNFIIPLICCKKSKRRLFSTADAKINEYLDLLNFVRRMQILDSIVERMNPTEFEFLRKEAVDMLDDKTEKQILGEAECNHNNRQNK